SGDYTPRAQEDIDDSLYVYGKHGPQPQFPSPTVSNASSIVFSICPSNDSDGELGTVTDHSVNDDSIPIPSSEQDTSDFLTSREAALKSQRVNHANVRQASPAWTNINRVNKANQFTPRPVNIRPNLSMHVNTGRVNVNTGHGHVNSGSVHVNSGTQIKSGASRFNTGKQHINSGSVHVNAGTQIKSAASRFNTGKQHINSGCVHINTARVNRPVSNNTSPKPSQVNLNSPKKCFSKQSSPVNRHFSRNTAHKSNTYAVKGKMGTAVKTSAGCVWRKVIPLSNTNSGPTPESNVIDHPLKHMEHRGIFDSGCSGHMTGNRAHLEDYQELSKVGSVTFGGSKDSEEEEPEAQGRKSQDNPQDSSVQGLVTPPTTKVNTSGEEQVEEISPNTLEAAKTLSKVASLKPRSIDKGRRYKRRKETKGKKVVSSLDFQEEVDDVAEQVNTAGEEVNTVSEINTGSIKLNTGIEQASTVGEDKGQREGKAPMLSEETPKKSKEQILQEEASLAEAIRLDSLQKEEEAKQIHLDALLAQRIAEEEELTEQQKKRKAQVQFEAQHYTNEDWDLIRAKLEANAELSKSMLKEIISQGEALKIVSFIEIVL
ncbi:hypothetical protein Tco_0664952, partial [Tanacetum coccineum]